MMRDLKPDNVVTTYSGRAKLIDFGVGRLSSELAAGSFENEAIPGTPGYVAPEVLAKQLYDSRADLYSFGVLTWTLLTGGLLSENGEPEPPHSLKICPPAKRRTQAATLQFLQSDFELLREMVQAPPEDQCLAPLPSANASSFVLQLVTGEPSDRLSHGSVRGSPFFKEYVMLPQQSFVKANVLEDWLHRFER